MMSKITKNQRIHALEQQVKGLIKGYKGLSQHVDYTPEYEPKLKTLTQSVFDGQDEKWRFAAVDKSGKAYFLEPDERGLFVSSSYWIGFSADKLIGEGYDTSDWQNSLIEREKVELTGSDYYHSRIASHLLEFGQKLVVCFVSNISEADALSEKRIEVITSVDTKFTDADEFGWQFVVPINNQGEPLTASEVGL